MWQLYRILKLVDKNGSRTDFYDLLKNIKSGQRFGELFDDGFVVETEDGTYKLTTKGRQKLDELRQHRTTQLFCFCSAVFGLVGVIIGLIK
jgi:predicted transcriptional regulator